VQDAGKGRGSLLLVPLRRTELFGEIIGPLASLRNVQTYGFSKEQCEETIEALYRFPLPAHAAVTSVNVRFGDTEIVTELAEREDAETAYEEAKRMGQQATLITRESPDVFTLRIAGTCPDQDVQVATSYVQLAKPQGSGWSIRVPLTTAPRFVRGDEIGSRYANGQPMEIARDPGHKFALSLLIKGAASVDSDTHELESTSDSEGLRVRLRGSEVVPDRDCVISWHPEETKQKPVFDVYLHKDEDSGKVYFLSYITPPTAISENDLPKREIILVVDHSGSMQGPKWEAADWAAKSIVSRLADGDFFNVCLFHNRTNWLFDSPKVATDESREKARCFIDGNKDSGGTELGVALEQALRQYSARSVRSRHVLVITDAQVTDSGRILQLADKESEKPDRRRISIVCIDSAPNTYLAEELAQKGGGLVKFLTSDPMEGDIATALEEILVDWSQPILTDLTLEVTSPNVEIAYPHVQTVCEGSKSRIKLGDLPAKRTLWTVGRMPWTDQHVPEFKLSSPDCGSIAMRKELGSYKELSNRGVRHLFSAYRILSLEQLMFSAYSDKDLLARLIRLGHDIEKKMDAIYPENRPNDVKAAVRMMLIEESLGSGIPCCETGFVAKRLEAGNVVERTVPVANALPHGWSEDFITTSCYSDAIPATPCLSQPHFLDARYDVANGHVAHFERKKYFDCLCTERPWTLRYPSSVAHGSGKNKVVKVFEGKPRSAVLYDSASDQPKEAVPEGVIRGIRVELLSPNWNSEKFSHTAGDVQLLLFLIHNGAFWLEWPMVVVSLADLVRLGGTLPTNIFKSRNDHVRLVLKGDISSIRRSDLRMRVQLLVEEEIKITRRVWI